MNQLFIFKAVVIFLTVVVSVMYVLLVDAFMIRVKDKSDTIESHANYESFASQFYIRSLA